MGLQSNQKAILVIFFPNEAKYGYHTNFEISLFRRMWRSTFVPKTIFRRSICLKQIDQ